MNNNWQFPARVILDNEVQASDNAIKIVKIPLTNFIHTLYIKAKCTNGATSARNQSMEDVIDKIELIANGADVLFSMTPQEIKRWSLEQTGLNIPQVRTEIAGQVQEAVYPIMFGRSPFDPNYYLPAAKLTDLELRITYSPTIAATSFVTGTTTIGVFALMSMGAQPGDYYGTLAHKTVRSFTSLAAGDDQTLIPRGNNLRKLMVYAYEAATEPEANISRVKFDLNNGERQLFDINWIDLQEINKYNNWIVHEENIRAFIADTNTLDTKVSKITKALCGVGVVATVATDKIEFRRVVLIAGDRLTFEAEEADLTNAATSLAAQAVGKLTYVSVTGEGLSHAVVLDFSLAGESSILNTSQYDQVRLVLTQGNAGADVRISTQEVRVLG